MKPIKTTTPKPGVLKRFLEHLNGCSDWWNEERRSTLPGWVWGLWWTVLLAVIALTCGQSSKFIYIDF